MDEKLQIPLLNYLMEQLSCEKPEDLIRLDTQRMEQLAHILWTLPNEAASLAEWVDLLHLMMHELQCADCTLAVRTHVAALLGHRVLSDLSLSPK